MKILKKIHKFFDPFQKSIKLILEGDSFKDSFFLFEYFLKFPLRFYYRITRKKIKRSLRGEIIIKNKLGKFFCGKNIFAAWTASSFYEPKMISHFKLKKGSFIDVGANIGKYSIMLGKQLKEKGRVLAIEPEKENFKILNKNIKLNNLKNVIPIQKGLFSKKTKIKFYLGEEKEGEGSHSLTKKTKKYVIINVETLDNILREKKIKNVKLIKIDVEGAEADVLKGALKTLKKYHPRIIFEAWNEEYLKKVEKVLKPLNYKIEKISEENYLAY